MVNIAPSWPVPLVRDQSDGGSAVHEERPIWRDPIALAAAVVMFALVTAVVVVAARSHPGPGPATPRPAPTPSAVGPSPGKAEARWFVLNSGSGTGTGTLADGQLIVAGEDVSALDPRTGHERWRHAEKDRHVTGLAATGGVAVVETGPVGGATAAGPRRWTGLDAATGRVRWSRPALGRPVLDTDPHWAAYGGVVLARVTERAVTRLAGVDARTGTVRWRRAPDAGCAWSAYGPDDAPLAVAAERCGDRDLRVRAVDTRTGRDRWSRWIPGGAVRRITAYGDVTQIVADEPLLIDATGRDVRAPGCTDRCRLRWADAARMYLGEPRRLGVLDRGTGTTTWIGLPHADAGAFAVADGTAYLTYGQDARPALDEVRRTRSGLRHVRVPLTVRGRGHDLSAYPRDPVLEERLFIVDHLVIHAVAHRNDYGVVASGS